jgi:hypothetical protein
VGKRSHCVAEVPSVEASGVGERSHCVAEVPSVEASGVGERGKRGRILTFNL